MIHHAASDLLVERLSTEQIATVFPLMRAADPGLSLAAWRRFARRSTTPTRRPAPYGVLVARRPAQRYPSGAVYYARHRDMHGTSVLTAEHFVALDLLYPEAVISALIAGLEPVAMLLGCCSIRSIVKNTAMPLIETLQLQGHRAEAVTFIKSGPQRAVA
jgi:hypothetical protein